MRLWHLKILYAVAAGKHTTRAIAEYWDVPHSTVNNYIYGQWHAPPLINGQFVKWKEFKSATLTLTPAGQGIIKNYGRHGQQLYRIEKVTNAIQTEIT